MQNVSPCFTPGTLIATERGRIPVEDLKRGDRVVTRDNGLQRISWIGRRDVAYEDLAAHRDLQPILIRQGALGQDRPHRDMIVSPNHRMLVGPDVSPLMGGRDEALVAAKHMIDHRMIRQVRMLGVSYLHFLCHAHEVVLADGAWTESFHPDDRIMKSMAPSQRNEILELFPEIATIGAAHKIRPARPIRKSRFET